MSAQIAKQIHAAILEAKKIMLVPHQHPDGDTLGSVTAMMEWLHHIRKPHVSFCSTDISEKLHFLPRTKDVRTDDAVWQDPDIDLVIVFDSGDLRYAGVHEHVEGMKKRPTIVNIDHHATNEQFGDLNLVSTTVPSTTAILHGFFSMNEVHINPTMATCLLTGLITDTGSFTNAATNAASLTIGSDLVLKGGDLSQIHAWTLKDRSVNGLKLWGTVLSRMELDTELNIVHTYVTREDILLHEVAESETEGIANFLNTMDEGRAGMILTEKADGLVKGSFRTTRDDVDVSAFAKALGGGGHKKAAGFTVAGPIEFAKEHVFTTIRRIEEANQT